jgi:peptidoglycan/LPS O-acetylase OafA/YrhL
MIRLQESDLDLRKRIERLDGYRGILCLIVLMHHYYFLPVHERPHESWSWWYKILFQSYGVIDSFFALSGWLIGTILLENRNSPHYFRTFYMRRGFRVLPMYFITLGVYFIMSKTVETQFPWLFNDPLIPLWSYPLALQTIMGGVHGTVGDRFIYVTWSLVVEFHFYLMAPFIVRYFSRRAVVLLFCGLMALATYLRFLAPGEGNVWMRTLLFWRPEAIFGGLVLSYFTHDNTINNHKHKFIFWILWLFLLPGIVLCALDYYMGIFLYPWFSFTSLAFFAALLLNPWIFRSLFELKPLQYLGEWSYSIYLWHMPILGIFFQFFYHRNPVPYTENGLLPGLLCLIITICWGGLLYNLVEKPFLKLGKKFTYNVRYN